MCVRTKTSYGCGHEYKTTNECGSSRCTTIERYHYPKPGDCRECKRGGEGVTRGREGRGRYAREISRRSHDREAQRDPLLEITGNATNKSLDVGAGISPWAASQNTEKDWGSPTRVMADHAWLQEHVERNTDLLSIRETLSSSSSEHSCTVVESPIASRDEPIYDYEEDRHRYEHDMSDHEQRRQMDKTERNLQVEIRTFNDEHDRRSRRPTHTRGRQDSQESIKSLQSTRSSSRRQHKPSTTSYAVYEYRDSGYGSYGSRASTGYDSTTEAYMYSPQPRTIKVRNPSTTSYGVYHSGFGVAAGAVDIVTRAPGYAYSHRRY